MKMKVLAAAVLASVASVAQAEVVVYGMAMPFLDNARTSGATQGAPTDRPNQVPASAYTGVNDLARYRITVGTSNWGFRGTEDLTPELKAVWQLESGFQIDQNTGPGLGARDSKVGLRGNWGEVFMGQWDTPYKYISLAVNPIRAGYVFDRTAITGNPGMGVPTTTTQFTRIGGKADASFDRRQGNSVQYWSPNLGGFTFRLQYSVDEGRGPIVGGGPDIKPTVASGLLEYDVGKLSLRYAYEQHNDYFGMSQLGGSAAGTATNQSSKDFAHKFVVLYVIGKTRLTAIWEQLDYKNNDNVGGNISEYKRNAYYGVIEQRFANNSSVFFSYGHANQGSCTRVSGLSCSTTDLAADYMTVGYIYRFSPATEGFVSYYRLNNKASAQYSTGPQAVGVSPPSPGADTSAGGVGIIHYF
jgi:predicted porin